MAVLIFIRNRLIFTIYGFLASGKSDSRLTHLRDTINISFSSLKSILK